MMRRTALLFSFVAAASPAAADDLLQSYELSLRNDPRITAIRSGYEAAIEARPQARALLLPQVGASGEYAYNREKTVAANTPAFTPGTEKYKSTFLGLNLSQSVFDFSLIAQLRQADAVVRAAEAQRIAGEQDQMLNVAIRYFNVLAAEDSLRTARGEKSAIAGQLERARKRFEVGLSPVLDVQETQARYDVTVAQEIEARRVVRSTREALREVTGRFPERLSQLKAEIPLETPDPQDAEQWVQAASRDNLKVRSAQAQAEVAQQDVQAQTGGHYPSLNLVGSYEYLDRLEAPFGREQETGTLGLQLAVPLYAGGGVQSLVRQAVHTHEQRRAELELARREVERQTRDAYEGVVVGISRVEALNQAVISGRTALQTTEAGYRVGARTAIDTLDAQSALYIAERDYARARYDYLINTLILKQAAGRLSLDDLKRVNVLLTENAAAETPPPSGTTPAAPGYPPGVTVAPEQPVKLPAPLPPEGEQPPAPEPAAPSPDSAQ